MRILVADGIGTAGASSGVIDRTAERLQIRTGARCEWVRWPAAMAGVGGRSSTWITGAREGFADLERCVAADEDELILLAYSGGNRIVHDFLDRRPDCHHRIRAVGLMSDPFRPRNRWQSDCPAPSGWGICGEREGPIPERTIWCAAPGDVITAAEPDALLRTIADLAANVPGGLRRDVREVLLAGRFQLSWQVDAARAEPLSWMTAFGKRLGRAKVDVQRYFSGWHTTHYTEPEAGGLSLAERLADQLLQLPSAPSQVPSTSSEAVSGQGLNRQSPPK